MKLTRLPALLVVIGTQAIAQVPTQAQPIQALQRVRANDNRARAGISSGNVLAVRLEARMAMWHPDGDDAAGAPIPVFAEIGRAPQVPGPLIRVTGGTDIIATVRNALYVPLTIHGLHSRPAIGEQFNDSIVLGPGATHTLRFRLDRPGTYYYWGTTTGKQFGQRFGEDAQLTGAIVVDEPGQRPARDRIFVLGMWSDTIGSEFSRSRRRELWVVNGRSYPNTDRLVYAKGDTVRWRVINGTTDAHPMHLHGFYFRVNRRGDGRADSVQSTRDMVNTERMLSGTTMSVTWIAERLGNWLFHCHIPEHIEARGSLGMRRERGLILAQAGQMHTSHATEMGGLVSAIEIRPAEDDTTKAAPPAPATRRLRMWMQPSRGSTPHTPFYGVSLDSNGIEPPPDSGQRSGPVLLLNKGEPTSIMLQNRLPEATSVHWHGIELESLYDGVPGVSGSRSQVATPVAPNDSFEVRITPPRAGTFIYHAHVNEIRQQRAGLAGALIVVDKGKFDATRDFPILLSSPSDSALEENAVLINGSPTPAPLQLRRGSSSRLRLINITTGRPGIRLELRQDSTVVTWRPVAKDGADLPAARRVVRPARQPLAIGETMDVEFFPTRPGDYRLEMFTNGGRLLATQIIRVQ
jgi:FtsP/CotA-like multicopper oxidase with cupredoxin domain